MTMINSMCDRPTIQIETCPNKHVMHGPRCTKELSCTAAANIFVLIHTLVLVLCPQTFELAVPFSGTILKSTVRHNSAPTIRAKICNAKSEPRQSGLTLCVHVLWPDVGPQKKTMFSRIKSLTYKIFCHFNVCFLHNTRSNGETKLTKLQNVYYELRIF